MLSILALLFFLLAAICNAIPMLAIVNGVYDGDQALMSVIGIVPLIPGLVLVSLDTWRRGWRAAKIGWAGFLVVWLPFVVMFMLAGFCGLTGVCGDLGKPAETRLK